MASDYNMLRKAKLVDDLFVSDFDEAASLQEAADRDWAREQDRDVVGDLVVSPPPAPTALSPAPMIGSDVRAPIQRLEVAPELAPAAEPAPQATSLVPAAEAQRSWPGILAELTGNPNLAEIRVLGVCGLNRREGAGEATAALGRWISQHSDSAALVVEAHFGSPRHALQFRARDAGVTEALTDGLSLDDAIHDTADAGLKLLPGGAPAGLFSRGDVIARFPELFLGLRDKFDTILVELPAADDRTLDKLPVSSMVEAVLLIADPKSAPAKKLRRASERFHRMQIPLAAVVISSPEDLSAALRRERLANQVQDPATVA